MDLNVVTFSGRLGADPEMRYVQSGTAVTNFRMAVQLAKEKTLWFDVTAWGKLAETANQYLEKGSRVAVSGRLDVDEWEGRDGTRRTTQKIVANEVRFLDSKKKQDQTEQRVAPEPDGGKVDDLIDEGFDGLDEFPI